MKMDLRSPSPDPCTLEGMEEAKYALFTGASPARVPSRIERRIKGTVPWMKGSDKRQIVCNAARDNSSLRSPYLSEIIPEMGWDIAPVMKNTEKIVVAIVALVLFIVMRKRGKNDVNP